MLLAICAVPWQTVEEGCFNDPLKLLETVKKLHVDLQFNCPLMTMTIFAIWDISTDVTDNPIVIKNNKGILRKVPPQHWVNIGWSGAVQALHLQRAFRIVLIYQ